MMDRAGGRVGILVRHHVDRGMIASMSSMNGTSSTPASDLSIEAHDAEGVTTVTVSGELDLHSASELREFLTDLFGEGKRRFVVDMQQVEFLDTTGLGVLVGGLKKAQSEGGSLEIICSQARVLRVFDLTGLSNVFTIRAGS